MVERDGVEELGLYLDWLRRRLPGWKFYAECNEGQPGWIGVMPSDPSIPARQFYFPRNRESEGMVNLHIWLMDLHRKKALPPFTWGQQA